MSHASRNESLTGEDPGLNMTPMIDIVFQLIVFFLLTLKFKSVDSRIDSSLPRNLGQRPTMDVVEDVPKVVVKLFRENHGASERAFTRLRVGNRWTGDLPAGDGLEARDRVIAALTAELAAVHAELGADAEGEIKTPLPKGAAVPHGDVMAVLDAFLNSGLEKVGFEGAPSPLPVRD